MHARVGGSGCVPQVARPVPCATSFTRPLFRQMTRSRALIAFGELSEGYGERRQWVECHFIRNRTWTGVEAVFYCMIGLINHTCHMI